MNEYDNLQIRKLDGGLLLIFRELLIRGQASEVAKQLGLSPSAVSHALGRLRDLFGEPLFIRRAHGLEPTQRARELGPRVEALIEMIGATISTDGGFDPGRSRRRFRIACPEYIASQIGERLVDIFRRDAPRAAFSTRWAVLDRALRAVRRGEVDVALGIFPQIPAGLTARPLYDDDYCVIARRGHPVIKGSVDLATYARIGHVFCGTPDGALSDDAPIDREAMDVTYGSIPAPNLVRTHAYVSQWETAMIIVSGTDVLADCPRRLAVRLADTLGLQVLDPPTMPFPFTIQAVYRKDAGDEGVDWLLARLDEAVAD
jgi:LysR family transcriptional activator of mexEF-oprN operon